MITTNYLVIGSGVAGLTFAVKIAEKFPHKTITIVTKGDEDESNTKYAQGGVAVVLNTKEDSFQKHIQDTLIAGDGLCNQSIVEMVIKEGPKRFNELITWGASFDLNAQGNYDLGKEGGHSENRVVHHKDITGYEIERSLLQRIHQLANITLLSHHFAIDLITEHHLDTPIPKQLSCYGAYVLNQKTGNTLTIKAGSTLLASGGIGSVYGHTTNPSIATGDGVAMAYRAKANIQDMEFIQFHPTALYTTNQGSAFLISEAVRGFGAYLRTKKGHRFMPDYDPRAELASRDIVSQSIDTELKKTGDTHVYLDCTHLDIHTFRQHFPTIYEQCKRLDIDISKDWIPVVPASHYLCGGIVVDQHGKTTLINLFSCGECSRTGLHGANRLASNSLLEALVYAHNIYTYISSHPPKHTKVFIPDWNDDKALNNSSNDFIRKNTVELQKLMRNYVGIVRSNDTLKIAIEQLDSMYNKVEDLYKTSKINTSLCELRNMINVAHLIITQSLERKENKGGYYNSNNLNSKKVLENNIT
ncbi:L-aspartate oxidase [Aquimarina sp. I32.4]|uniref:L-aspartate oxidase n=1 Tax=Aquimarina sp. I32.4 TaxID=2053903 RepID=UPI000CDE5804|nr:L-aspartate oxidase [Aquimarina sp. I32.4]